MAVPQQPYQTDPYLRPRPGDPGAIVGTLEEVPGVVGDALDWKPLGDTSVTPPPPPAPAPPPAAAEPPPAAPPAQAVEPTPTPPAAPPPAAPAIPTAVKTETERTVLSPESKAALEHGTKLSTEQTAQADKLASAQKAKTASDLRLEQDLAKIDADRAAADQKVVDAAAVRQDQERARFQASHEKFLQRREAAEQRVAAAHAAAQQDYYADKSTGYKILQGLLTFSSIKSSLTLGQDPNDSPFMRMARETLERDKERKMAEVRASKEYVDALRRGDEEARQFLLDARADIEAGTAQQLKITLAKAEALKASRKVDPKLLETNIAAAIAEQDAKVLETQQAWVQRDLARSALGDRKVTTTTAPMTAAQMKAAGGAGGGHPLFDLKGNQVGVTQNLKLSNDAAEKRAGALDSQRLGAQLAAHIREYGPEVLPGGGKAERDSLVRDLVSALVRARSGTAASDKERAQLTTVVMPSLINQLTGSNEKSAKSVEAFVAREINRYHDFVESSSDDPKQARALLRSDQPTAADPDEQLSVEQLRRVLATSKDKTLVAKARALLAAKGQ